MPSESTTDLLNECEQQLVMEREIQHPILDRIRRMPSFGVRLESLYSAALLLEDLETAMRMTGLSSQPDFRAVDRVLRDLDAFRKTLPEVP